MIDNYINDNNVVNIYEYGSHVYGTANKMSDNDYIIVCNKWFDSKNTDIHVFTIDEFKRNIDICNISVLECLFLSKKHIIKENIKFDINIDKYKLREYISTITSNSYVKGKKKLTVTGDYDLRAGLKSIYHSLRILDYGIQLATDNQIYNYTNMNWVLADLYKMSETNQGIELWNVIHTKYNPIKNKMASQFKELCPKQNNNKKILSNIISKYNVELNQDMINEILETFKL